MKIITNKFDLQNRSADELIACDVALAGDALEHVINGVTKIPALDDALEEIEILNQDIEELNEDIEKNKIEIQELQNKIDEFEEEAA